MKNVSLISITLGFVLVALIGCQRNYTVYERHDITACGVKDPLVNVKWLAEKCEEIKKGKCKETTISLLKDTITQDNAFMIRYHYKQRGKDICIAEMGMIVRERYSTVIGLEEYLHLIK